MKVIVVADDGICVVFRVSLCGAMFVGTVVGFMLVAIDGCFVWSACTNDGTSDIAFEVVLIQVHPPVPSCKAFNIRSWMSEHCSSS
jgi:hypothetical protein